MAGETDPIAEYLKPLGISNLVKKQAWDAVSSATDDADLTARLKQLPVGNEIKKQLFDLYPTLNAPVNAIARRDPPAEKSWSDKAWDLGKDTTEAALRIVPAVAGSIGGATVGAAGGATVGTSIPVLGTVAGGVAGGIAGGMAGGAAGAATGEGLAQKFHNWAYDIPEQDLNLNQVGLAAFLGLIPGSRVASPALKAAMALPVLRQGVEAAARSGGAQAVEQFLASKGATAAAKSVASWAGYGAADSTVMAADPVRVEW